MNKLTKPLTNLFVKSNLTPKKSTPTIVDNQDHNWIRYQSKLPWLELNMSVPYNEILGEIKLNSKFLVDHRDEYGEHQGWKSFCIHGKELTETGSIIDDRPYHWIPEIVTSMPVTVNYFKSWGLDFYRLRVMALEPGGFVSVHQDVTVSSLSPINIAITQPEGCKFVVEGWGVVPFKVGTSFMLDIANRHAVINNSNETRYHIIAHYAELNNKFKKIVEDSYYNN